MKQRDERRAIRVVLHRGHFRWNSGLITFEIDDPIEPFGSAAPPAHRDVTIIVPAGDALLRFEQRLVRSIGRYLLMSEVRLKPPGRRRWSEFLDPHHHSIADFGFRIA